MAKGNRKSLDELNAEDVANRAPGQDDGEQVIGSGPDGRPEDPSIKEIEDMLKANDLEGGSLRLSRRGPLDTGFAYIGKFRIKDFDIEQVKRMYGGGDYKAQTFRASGQLGKGFAFSIDPRFKGVIEVDTRAAQQAPGNGQQIDIPRIMEMMKPQQDNSMKELMQMMQKSSESSLMMMMQMMQQSTQVMVAAMTSAANRPQPENQMAMLMPVLIEMIKAGKEGGKGGSTMAEILTGMKQVKDLMSDDKDPEEKEEDSFGMKLIKAIGPAVLPAIMGGSVVGPAPASRVAPGRISAPGPGPGHSQSAPGNSPQGSSAQAQPGTGLQPEPSAQSAAQPDATANMIGIFMVQLVGAAEKQSDPGLYHDLIVDALGDEHAERLLTLLKSDDWLEQMYGAQPDILARAKIQIKWFEGLRSMLLESLDAPDEPIVTPAAVPPPTPAGG